MSPLHSEGYRPPKTFICELPAITNAGMAAAFGWTKKVRRKADGGRHRVWVDSKGVTYSWDGSKLPNWTGSVDALLAELPVAGLVLVSLTEALGGGAWGAKVYNDGHDLASGRPELTAAHAICRAVMALREAEETHA